MLQKEFPIIFIVFITCFTLLLGISLNDAKAASLDLCGKRCICTSANNYCNEYDERPPRERPQVSQEKPQETEVSEASEEPPRANKSLWQAWFMRRREAQIEKHKNKALALEQKSEWKKAIKAWLKARKNACPDTSHCQSIEQNLAEAERRAVLFADMLAAQDSALKHEKKGLWNKAFLSWKDAIPNCRNWLNCTILKKRSAHAQVQAQLVIGYKWLRTDRPNLAMASVALSKARASCIDTFYYFHDCEQVDEFSSQWLVRIRTSNLVGLANQAEVRGDFDEAIKHLKNALEKCYERCDEVRLRLSEVYTSAFEAERLRRLDATAQNLIDKATKFKILSASALGQTLANRIAEDGDLVGMVIKKVKWLNRDNVSLATLQGLTPEALAQLSQKPKSTKALREIFDGLNDFNISDTGVTEIERLLPYISATHGHLASLEIPDIVKTKLAEANAELQLVGDGSGRYHFDHYSITILRFPFDHTPQTFMKNFLADIHLTVQGDYFKTLTKFYRRNPEHEPSLGDIVDLDIIGLDNAAVVVSRMDFGTDKGQFTFSTITTKKERPPSNVWRSKYEHDTHPIYGNREFGYFKNSDGSYTLYTRAVERRRSDLPTRVLSGIPQHQLWETMMKSVSKAIRKSREGGAVKLDSYRHHKDPFADDK